MARRTFTHRTESFGYQAGSPWAAHAFSLLFAVPRVYKPLLDAWEVQYPGTKKALERLVRLGFVEYQAAVIVDVRKRTTATRIGVPVSRFRATAKGKRLAVAALEDVRVLHDTFPRVTDPSAPRVAALLGALVLEPPHSRYGISALHAGQLAGMPERSSRWWIQHLVDQGYAVELPDRLPDVREVVPAHWRVTRTLCSQLDEVIDAFPQHAPASMRAEYRLRRTRFLSDIDPARVGLTGATDYDHDIESQRVIAAMMTSSRFLADGVFTIEPRISLSVDTRVEPWVFPGPGNVFYQPDAELRERADDGQIRRSVLEYERFQSRRDAWSHIERFLGWLHQMALPTEPAVLRFVVDTEARVRSYVDLIEAFADYLIDHPDRLPGNEITLAVSSVGRILGSADPLADGAWFRISLPEAERSDTVRRPVLHTAASPYDDYFTRG